MIDLYLRLRAHQNHLQQQQQQEQGPYQQSQNHQHTDYRFHQQQGAPQQAPRQDRPSQQPDAPINLSTSRRQNVDRIYTELQTVRPGVAVDASEVLRRHNDGDDRVDDDIETSSPVPGTSGNSRSDHRTAPTVVKEELILPKTPSFQDSVVLQSVRPPPASVSVVSRYVPASGKIGRGKWNTTAFLYFNIYNISSV